jgi:hypothetical protein
MEPIFVDTAYGVVIYIYPLLKKSTFKKSGAKYNYPLYPLLEKVEQNIISTFIHFIHFYKKWSKNFIYFSTFIHF